MRAGYAHQCAVVDGFGYAHARLLREKRERAKKYCEHQERQNGLIFSDFLRHSELPQEVEMTLLVDESISRDYCGRRETRKELVHGTDDQRVNSLFSDGGCLQPESSGVTNHACLSDHHDDV